MFCKPVNYFQQCSQTLVSSVHLLQTCKSSNPIDDLQQCFKTAVSGVNSGNACRKKLKLIFYDGDVSFPDTVEQGSKRATSNEMSSNFNATPGNLR